MATPSTLAILVVEDDLDVGRAIVKGIAPIQAELVTTIAAARGRMRDARHAAWVFDVLLPDGNGVDLLRWGREREPRVPAIVMTGADPREFINQLYELGAEPLMKPFGRHELLRLLRDRRGGSALASAERYASEYALPRRERDLIVLYARGVPRVLFPSELGIKESAVKSATRRLLDRVGAHSMMDVLNTILRDADNRQ